MKIELQSGWSDFGDFEENRHYDENSVFNPKKNLWNASNSNSDRRRSGSLIPRSRDPEHDDDFEFVITRSETAKRVKKPNSNSFMHHNYANSNEKYNSRHSYDHSQTSSNSYGKGTGKHENNYHKYDNPNNYSKYNNASTGYRGSLEDSPTAYRRKSEQKAHNKLGHPGLDRKIDFDPFVSGSNSEDDSGSVHEDDAFTYRKDVRHFEHGFPDQHLTSVTYTNRSLLPKRRYIFLAKIKIFFKFVGVGIKRCYNKSRTYISKVIRKTKDKRRNRIHYPYTDYIVNIIIVKINIYLVLI